MFFSEKKKTRAYLVVAEEHVPLVAHRHLHGILKLLLQKKRQAQQGQQPQPQSQLARWRNTRTVSAGFWKAARPC